jgi:hypothetical protein
VRIVDVTELGRKGGRAAVAGRWKERKAASGHQARWDAYYKEHPVLSQADGSKEKEGG